MLVRELKVNECVKCVKFPCNDVKHECYMVPNIIIKPECFSIVMISEAAPESSSDYYYAKRNPLFQQTTVQAFKDAGKEVSSIQDLLDNGVYFTTAVKCGKIGYGIKSSTVEECSILLEKELALFPNVKVIMLMGDIAIKAINSMAKRSGEPRIIPSGATYKIRNQKYMFHDKRVFPSYLQAGPSFFIEKSKRRMIAEDIASALALR
jgi:hypothetical protein